MPDENKPLAVSKPRVSTEADLSVQYGSDTHEDMILALTGLRCEIYKLDGSDMPRVIPSGRPRLYLNGFPKSGLHMLTLFTLGLAQPDPEKAWLSSFKPSPWHTDWIDFDFFEDCLRELPTGASVKGHAGYHPAIRDALERNGYGHIFIYRDLRDVAISQAFHVTSDDSSPNHHPGKDFYRSLPTMEDVIITLIQGTREYPGLIERWRQYAGWLTDDWTLAVNYADARRYPGKVCQRLIQYHFERPLVPFGMGIRIDTDDLQKAGIAMGRHAQRTDMSATYRSGKVGEWLEYWTDRIDRAFEDAGGREFV